jgi:hypothetical protein
MRVTPLSWEPVHVTDPNGQTVPMPLTVTLP